MMVRLTLKVLMSMMMKVDDDDIDSGIRKQNPGEGWLARSTSWSSDPISLSSGSWSAFLLIINYDDICRQKKRQSFFGATKKARAANGSRLDDWICLFDLSCEKLDITISVNNNSNINKIVCRELANYWVHFALTESLTTYDALCWELFFKKKIF